MTKLLSVAEYAAIHGKNPGNIRRYLASGRMEGYKSGRRWVIPEDSVYPAGRKTVRKGLKKDKGKGNGLDALLIQAVMSLTDDFCEIYRDALQRVILYGSYARGTQTEESDVDIALILCRKPERQMTDEMVRRVSSYELKLGKVLSVIDIQSEKYSAWKDVLPFYQNIDREGIILWKTV